MTHEKMLFYLRKRLTYLTGQIEDAKAVGRNLTWAMGEQAALRQAVDMLSGMKPKDEEVPS